MEYAIKENHNLKHPTELNMRVRSHIYKGINTLTPEEYFAEKFPIHPSIAERIKNLLPMRMKLVLKKILWKIKGVK